MKIKFAITALCAALLTGCGVAIKYSLSGASIPPDAKTFSVAYFQIGRASCRERV